MGSICHLRWLLWKNYVIYKKHIVRTLLLHLMLVTLFIVNLANAHEWLNESSVVTPLYYTPQCSQTRGIMEQAIKHCMQKKLMHTPFQSAENWTKYVNPTGLEVILLVEFIEKRCDSNNEQRFKTEFDIEILQQNVQKLVEKYAEERYVIADKSKWIAKIVSKDLKESTETRWKLCCNSLFITWVAILLTSMSYFTAERKADMVDSLKEIGVSYFVIKFSWELIFFVQLLPFTFLYIYLMLYTMPKLDIPNTIFFVLFVATSLLIWMNLPIWLVWHKVRFSELLALILLFLTYCIASHAKMKYLKYLSIAFLWNESFEYMVDFNEGTREASIQYRIWYEHGIAIAVMDVLIYVITLIDVEYINLIKSKINKNRQGKRKVGNFGDDLEDDIESHSLYPTVELVNVSKRYFPFFSFQEYVDAVTNVTLTFYKHELAVVLGENGSGKTTLVSLITGAIKPSHGRCFVKLIDTLDKKEMKYFRKLIGVCHQYNNNRHYNDLTVLQHMILFSCLRGLKKDFASRDSFLLLNEFGVAYAANTYHKNLPRDVHRRVNIALAFTGETNVVILDDPTNEIDPSARRSIWKTLKQMRKDRCIILFTKSLQEAEYCSDRLAILNNGTIRCHGSLDFIKNRFGIGNHLIVTQSGNYDPNHEELKEYLHDLFPNEDELFSEEKNVVKYSLRHHNVEYNDLIFEIMESNAERLDITNCKIAVWSLEDIILNLLCENANLEIIPEEKWNLPLVPHFRVVCTQYRGIFYKLFLVFKYTFFRILLILFLFTLIRFDLWHRKKSLDKLKVTYDMVEEIMDINFSIYLNILYPLSMCFLVDFYIQEKTSGFKFLQYVSGVKFIIMWTSALGKDLLIIFISLSIMWCITSIFPDLFMDSKDIGIFMMIFMVYSFALLSFFYLILLRFRSTNAFTTMIILTYLLTGLFYVYDYQRKSGIHNYNLTIVLHHMFIFIPPYAFINMFYNVYKNYGIYELCYVTRTNPSNYHNDVALYLKCKEVTKYEQDTPLDRNIFFSCGMLFVEGIIFWMIFYTVEEIYGRLNRCTRFGLFSEPIKSFVHPKLYTPNNKNVQRYNTWNLGCSRPQIWTHPVFVRDVSKAFLHGKLQILNHLFFSLREGECFGLLGKNGSGKSTALKILVGDLMLVNGNAWICGHNVKTQISQIHKKIGYCPQLDAVYDLFTVYNILKFFCLIRGYKKYIKEIIEVITKQLDLINQLYDRIHNLNVGNKRKVSIAIAILGDPQVILLDEPTTGVGIVARRRIWHVLNSLRRKGKTLIVTTENIKDCEVLCTNIGILNNGSMAFIGSLRKLRYKYNGTYIVNLTIERYVPDIDELLKAIENSLEKYFHPRATMDIISRDSRRYIKCKIRRNGLQWHEIHRFFRTNKKNFHLKNFSLSEISLEEIYLDIVDR